MEPLLRQEVTAAMKTADALQMIGSTAYAAENAASLFLLTKIDDTVDGLFRFERMFEGFCRAFSSMADAIDGAPVESASYLDEDDGAINALDLAVGAADALLPSMLLRKRSIDRDGELSVDHRDRLHCSYDRAVMVLADVIETCKRLRAAIIRHDLAAEPRDGRVFESSAELIRELRGH